MDSAPNFELKSKIKASQAGYDSASTNQQEFKFTGKPKKVDSSSDSDYGWEEFEAFQDFEQRKNTLIRQGVALEERDLYRLHPYQREQCVLDGLRLVGALIFLTDLLLKVAYYRTSKFISYEIKHLFFLFIIARPIFIGLYHAFQMCMTTHKLIYHYKA